LGRALQIENSSDQNGYQQQRHSHRQSLLQTLKAKQPWNITSDAAKALDVPVNFRKSYGNPSDPGSAIISPRPLAACGGIPRVVHESVDFANYSRSS
jgi:hypothetical protein